MEVLGYKMIRHQDWFYDQDLEARRLLYEMQTTHLAWINDKSNMAKKSVYNRARQQAQVSLQRRNGGPVKHWSYQMQPISMT